MRAQQASQAFVRSSARVPPIEVEKVHSLRSAGAGGFTLGDAMAAPPERVTAAQHRTAMDSTVANVASMLDSLPRLRPGDRRAAERRINATITALARSRVLGARVFVNDDRVEQLVETATRRLRGDH
jgi:hypothetical protein